MLGWITGQNPRPTDDSTAMEPPETPAPVFAMRAFKSAIFGTPAGDSHEHDDTNSERPAVSKQDTALMRKRNTMPSSIEVPIIQLEPKEKSSADPANQLSASPTKSILVTPGTTSNRRKTVSFGETAFQREFDRDQVLPRSNSAAPSSAGSVTSQWMSSQADGKSRPRSRLTQSLLDAKENKEKNTEELPRGIGLTSEDPSVQNTACEDSDETIDLNDPRSRSGQYWKTEFEQYRKKTSLEMTRLIHCRAAVKSYARKKDIEAMRLRTKLQEEEDKFEEMEQRVKELASDMMRKDVDADREEIVQDLAKQTALALQYKHKVDTLRKTLEQYGVIGSGQSGQMDSESGGSSLEDQAEIYRLRQALDHANKMLEERNQDDELEKLRKLAKSSEDKANELERENILLKKNIVRVKSEMGQYEIRRTEKEAKLKERAARYEARYEGLKGKMRDYQGAVDQERKIWAQQYRALRDQLQSLSEEKSYTGVQVHDFGAPPSLISVNNDAEVVGIDPNM